MSDVIVARLGTGRVLFIGFLGLTAVTALGYFWQADSVFWIIGAVIFGMGLFMGKIMASSTDAAIGIIPEETAGAGSGLLGAVRMVASALGVAVLGSVLSGVYSSSFQKGVAVISGLPDEILAVASDSTTENTLCTTSLIE